MKKAILIIVILAIVLIGGYLIFAKGYNNSSSNSTTNLPNNSSDANKITIKNFAFDPPTITVKSGTTVTWTNEDSADHFVASDPHPTHTDLPGLSSNPFSQGQSYSFTFTKVGTFGYHCHLHPSMKGTVIVAP